METDHLKDKGRDKMMESECILGRLAGNGGGGGEVWCG
jgi:hypothetical protein